jgi:hypothetical protein
MSTLTASDVNNMQNGALGVVVFVAFALDQIPVYLSAYLSKHPAEDGIKEEDKKPIKEGSAGHRCACIARNNGENLWQGVIVMIAANIAVARGTSPAYDVNMKDNAGMFKLLTVMMYLFMVCCTSRTICYKLALSAPVPLRSLCFVFGNLAVWIAAFLIPIACSQFKKDTSL